MKRLFLKALIAASALGCTEKDIDVEGPAQPNLRSWLDSNVTIRDSIKLENDSNPSYYYGGTLGETSYTSWSEADKLLLDQSFARAWQWLYQSNATSILGEEEFSMPLQCSYCETRLVSVPNNGPFTVIPEALSKRAYIASVAHSLALEAGNKLSWSIASSSASQLHHFFNSRSVMHRLGGTGEFFFGEPGGGGDARIKYLGRSSPATPIYAYRWFVNNGLLKSTHELTINAVLDWFRTNGIHFYGSATYATMNEHWGYPSQPSAYHIILGTIRATESVAMHWTAGCHGTVGFLKSVLKSVNIPVEPIYTCNHAQAYFPTIDKYLDHGDNPYNATVKDQPTKSIAGVLIAPATYTTWFSASPDYLNPANPLCVNIGRAATEF